MFSRVLFSTYEITAVYSSFVGFFLFFFILKMMCHTTINPAIHNMTSLNKSVDLAGSPKNGALTSACHPRGSVAKQGLSPLLWVGDQELPVWNALLAPSSTMSHYIWWCSLRLGLGVKWMWQLRFIFLFLKERQEERSEIKWQFLTILTPVKIQHRRAKRYSP